jgi:hypothetical protein
MTADESTHAIEPDTDRENRLRQELEAEGSGSGSRVEPVREGRAPSGALPRQNEPFRRYARSCFKENGISWVCGCRSDR